VVTAAPTTAATMPAARDFLRDWKVLLTGLEGFFVFMGF
jgi:hypothetical protein